MDEYIGAGRMQSARDLGADTARAARDQYHLIAQTRILADAFHARQRYRKT
jgi:hypothetical protein